MVLSLDSDFKQLDENLRRLLSQNKNALTYKFENYIFSKSKRVRSLLCFLFSRAISDNVSIQQHKVAAAVELIHNATLIHDDIIDDAPLRRGNVSINCEFDNKLAVVAGDFLLALALNELLEINENSIIRNFTSSLLKICDGEITQYFDKNIIVEIDKYIDRSKQKTARLFEASLISVVALSGQVQNIENARRFAINYGIAFQIRDDLLNVLKTDPSKPYLSDIKNGVYTAPLIFLVQTCKNIDALSSDDLCNMLESSGAIAKTKELLGEYILAAIDSLEFLNDNCYKQSIIDLCNDLYEV